MNVLSNTILEKGFQGYLYTLHNQQGTIARFTSYGARWISMCTSDRQGIFDDVLLGFNSLQEYSSAKEQYHGAIVGRVCGRINNARFSLDGKEYVLAANDVYGKPAPNHLHGGNLAFHNRYWNGRLMLNEAGEEMVVFTCRSLDGEEGYPGNMDVEVSYTLRNDNVLCMECMAVCDKKTPVNLTNHAFFNLSGKQADILSHKLRIGASRIIECNQELIPTGNYISTERTDLDFSVLRPISVSMQSDLFQIKENKGFSLAFALDKKSKNGLFLAAELFDELSGRELSIYTNQLSLQVYTGYFMDGSDMGKHGKPYLKNAGIALETQGFPDAVNHSGFPSVILLPGQTYYHHTEYKFYIQ